jgi:hypothetical protein
MLIANDGQQLDFLSEKEPGKVKSFKADKLLIYEIVLLFSF